MLWDLNETMQPFWRGFTRRKGIIVYTENDGGPHTSFLRYSLAGLECVRLGFPWAHCLAGTGSGSFWFLSNNQHPTVSRDAGYADSLSYRGSGMPCWPGADRLSPYNCLWHSRFRMYCFPWAGAFWGDDHRQTCSHTFVWTEAKSIHDTGCFGVIERCLWRITDLLTDNRESACVECILWRASMYQKRQKEVSDFPN